ncbi:Urease accessory protein UreF [Candidatus Blochmanniella floridana]|uniref:Urease accessory protein UreF n=1 Tax=Blochmanniella floridana TaxID=203907 RepID=UREF_BLOFL|nr:RecName: Full=Urease accessory protein UreF [Candidatus Blochmannia floridanus]CAD83208.1 Urease accessory protein UreF [Candidatus Blochmannia floridanus]
MNIHRECRSLLSLIQIVSGNLPTGGFSYSKGLESAIEYGWVKSLEDFLNWQKQWIHEQLIYIDWPMLKRCYYYTKINDSKNFKKCALQILSYRDTYELRLEEQRRGKAMEKLISQWYDPISDSWAVAFKCSGLASMAWLGYEWNIPIKNLALGYAYNALESSIMVGLKLLPFGQRTAQKLLRYLVEFLPNAWDKADLVKDHEVGGNFLLQSIASACHEDQYSRLFSS